MSDKTDYLTVGDVQDALRDVLRPPFGSGASRVPGVTELP
jgi:hypothetical protein